MFQKCYLTNLIEFPKNAFINVVIILLHFSDQEEFNLTENRRKLA